jgi:hypothetical protein
MPTSIRSPRLLGCVVVAAMSGFAFGSGAIHAQSGTVLLQEGFEDSNFSARGWYDSTGATLSSLEKYAGSRAFECRFAIASTTCTGGSPRRHLFTPSDSVYLSFYIKHSANWVGSGRPYHPHMFHFVTNLDPAYVGPAYSYLTTYIEAIGGVPQLAIQDGRNIDESRIGVDLTAVTEQRSVAGCNGDSDGHGNGECYSAGSVHWNGKKWLAGAVYFDNDPASVRYKGKWHLVEAYFKLNSITAGKGNKDGIIRYWYDGSLILDHSNVVLRTGARATMQFNQFLMTPYIGDGSPADQTFWIDDVVVATGRPSVPPTPPGSTTSAPAAPRNLRIQ